MGAVRILATLLQPDEGRATAGGFDVVSQAHQVRDPSNPPAEVHRLRTQIDVLDRQVPDLGQADAGTTGRTGQPINGEGLPTTLWSTFLGRALADTPPAAFPVDENVAPPAEAPELAEIR
jgi:hypothetical protein